MHNILKIFSLGVACLAADAVHAQDTTNYEYDALGRLKTVSHQNGVANGVTSTYTYDAANNRTNVTVQGAQIRVIVVPLNGFTVIPLNQ